LKILEQLNSLKLMLKDIEIDAASLPVEIRRDFLDNLQEIRSSINQAGGIVEKYFKDEKAYETMKQAMLDRMGQISIYEGLDDKVKEVIADRIIRSNDMNLLTVDEFNEFVKDRLRTSSLDDLIKRSYTKYDIINLGEAVESEGASETKKYESGLGVLRGFVATPSGRNEAIAHGITKVMKDATLRKYYLSLYYNLTK
jgi:hypothetical protein